MDCKFKFSKISEPVDPDMLLNSIDESIADIIPTSSTVSDKLKSLIINIQDIGQIEPVLIYKGKLVDGRHRCLACRSLGIKVNANYIDENVSKDEVEDYVTNREFVNKDLNTWQKALIIYERYMEGRNYSARKASIKGNIRVHNLTALKYVLEHEFGKNNKYREAIRNNHLMKLPEGSSSGFTKSVTTARNALIEYDEVNAIKQDNKDGRVFHFAYEKALSKWDIDDKIGELFWYVKNVSDLDKIDTNINIMHKMLICAYDEYKDELTADMIKKEITLNDKG